MAITEEATDFGGASSTTDVTLSNLLNTEGNFQAVIIVHRDESLTPSITGDDWNTPSTGDGTLVETEIANTSARRAIALFYRTVPASQSAPQVGWSGASTNKVAVGFEWSSDTAGGTWDHDANAASDNGTTEGTSLASGSAAPANSEAVTGYFLVARNGSVEAEDTYSNSFVTGPSDECCGGQPANAASGFSGSKIASGTQTTTASWTTSALATGLIAAFSVSSGDTQAPAGLASVDAAALSPTSDIEVPASLASVDAAGNAATVSTDENTNAPAGLASVSAAAFSLSPSVGARAGSGIVVAKAFSLPDIPAGVLLLRGVHDRTFRLKGAQ